MSSITVRAAKPELIDSQQEGNNVVFTYKVSGEDIQDPKKTSHLYGYTDDAMVTLVFLV